MILGSLGDAIQEEGPGKKLTPPMVDKARENMDKGNYKNVEFRLGEIENLPVADNPVDVVISNCVINLSPDKKRVFMEAFRLLKPEGRLMVSDIVRLKAAAKLLRSSKGYRKIVLPGGFGPVMGQRENTPVFQRKLPKNRAIED